MESEHAVDQERRRSMRGSSPYAKIRSDEPVAPQKEGESIESEVNKVVATLVDTVCDELKGSGGDEQQQQKLSRKESSNLNRPSKRQEFRPSATPKPVYRTPEFRWSHIHIKLLSDLLLLIESDVATWKK